MKFTEFKLLTDENIDPLVVEFLRQKGFDVWDIKEMSWRGRLDIDILKEAHKQKRVVVTHDEDFGKLVFRSKIVFTGILYFRPGHFYPEKTIIALQRLFEQVEMECTPPFILVVEDKTTHIKIRLRNLV
jgi:predicted nuclease of predicted toxin-antitoxin system